MRSWLLCCCALALGITAPLAGANDAPTAAANSAAHSGRVEAIVGARVHVAPGEVIDQATILIQHRRIVGLGLDLAIPDGARRWDMSGKTIYPGLIDAYGEIDSPDEPPVELDGDDQRPVSAHHNPRVAPLRRAEQWYRPNAEAVSRWREQGFVARLVAPTGAILQGTSCLASTAEPDRGPWLIEASTALHLRLKPPRRGYQVGYPTSPMGAMALVRQSLLDAAWHARTLRVEQNPWPLERRPNVTLEVLARYLESERLVIIDAPDELYLQRADRLAREFALQAAICGSGEEYQRLAAVCETGRMVIVPLTFPPAPCVDTPEASLNISLERLLHWDLAPENPARLARAGVPICLTAHGLSRTSDFLPRLRYAVRRGLSPETALRALTEAPAKLLGVDDRLGTLAVGKQASFVVTSGDLFDSDACVTEVWIDGQPYDQSEEGGDGDLRQERTSAARWAARCDRPALFDVNYPLGAWGRNEETPPPVQTVLFRNATIWTSGPDGILEPGDMLLSDGRIVEVGRELAAPYGTLVIDARGKHITPGLIDCHSHIATDGGLTEAGRSSTGEVRIADYLDDEDVDLYRQLAGGVTCVNVLPGSDNTVCGQSQVIKMRWGQRPDALVMKEAPPGMKFALGENAKQSNWGDAFTSRYPQTRMGSEQLLLDTFRAAAAYRRQWQRWQEEQQGPRPRVDLELEAVVEVLDGKRRIHCHAYRQDEMLALLRTCAALDIPMGTFHHALEGYKIADLLAARQAGASIFSDWWAFKFEAYDGIPFNGAMLRRAGVLVSINSDDAELARRLHVEAAKVMKYGGLSAGEALAMVTINPAIQLGIDHVTGSLESGKQADLVVWSGSPLSTFSRCEQTWIDGRKYFDHEDDLKQRDVAQRKKAALIQRVLDEREAAD